MKIVVRRAWCERSFVGNIAEFHRRNSSTSDLAYGNDHDVIEVISDGARLPDEFRALAPSDAQRMLLRDAAILLNARCRCGGRLSVPEAVEIDLAHAAPSQVVSYGVLLEMTALAESDRRLADYRAKIESESRELIASLTSRELVASTPDPSGTTPDDITSRFRNVAQTMMSTNTSKSAAVTPPESPRASCDGHRIATPTKEPRKMDFDEFTTNALAESGDALWRMSTEQVVRTARTAIVAGLRKAMTEKHAPMLAMVEGFLDTRAGEAAIAAVLWPMLRYAPGPFEEKRARLAKELRVGAMTGVGGQILNAVFDPIREFLVVQLPPILAALPEPKAVLETAVDHGARLKVAVGGES